MYLVPHFCQASLSKVMCHLSLLHQINTFYNFYSCQVKGVESAFCVIPAQNCFGHQKINKKIESDLDSITIMPLTF